MSPMNKSSKLPLFGVLSLAAVVALATAVYFLVWHAWVWTNDAQIEGFGVDLSTNVTEQIIALHVDEGDVVKKGDLIALLQNNVPLAKKNEIDAKIVSLEQEIAYSKADFEKKRNDYLRAVEGIEDKVISQQHYDHREKDYLMAEAQLNLALANLELARREKEVVEAQLTHYEIRAPMDGVIAKRWVWLGDVTTPGQSLFTMFDLENVWVLANYDENNIRKVTMGAQAEIHVDAYPGRKFVGEVFTIKGAAASKFTLVPQNNATGNYTKVSQRIPVKISIRPENQEEGPLYLFPGMNVEVSIKTP